MTSGKPYSAGLLIAEPMHGKVLIHSVGDNTRIDYTPDVRFAGADSFVRAADTGRRHDQGDRGGRFVIVLSGAWARRG